MNSMISLAFAELHHNTFNRTEQQLLQHFRTNPGGQIRVGRGEVKQIFSAMPYDLYITNYEELWEYTTWLPHNISPKAANDYLLKYLMSQQDLQEYLDRDVDVVDLFMYFTSDENRIDNQSFTPLIHLLELKEQHHNIRIPKPKLRGKVKTRQKLINKLTHKKKLLADEIHQIHIDKLLYAYKSVPKHRSDLIVAMMRYSNAMYGKYIKKDTIKDVVNRAASIFEVDDYCFEGCSRRAPDQFMIDAAKGRLDHLHILESGDLNDFMNGNGRFEKPHDKKHNRMQRGSRMNDDHILSLIKQDLKM